MPLGLRPQRGRPWEIAHNIAAQIIQGAAR